MRREDGGRLAERGSAAVEFALTLPIALLVLIAILRVGLVARDRIVLADAARAGAREAAVSADEEVVRAAVMEAASALEGSPLVTVERTGGLGEPVRVTLVYEVPLLTGVSILPASVRLTASAVMRQEFG